MSNPRIIAALIRGNIIPINIIPINIIAITTN